MYWFTSYFSIIETALETNGCKYMILNKNRNICLIIIDIDENQILRPESEVNMNVMVDEEKHWEAFNHRNSKCTDGSCGI